MSAECRRVGLPELTAFLDGGSREEFPNRLVLALLDWNVVLGNESDGYFGHFCVVHGISGDQVWVACLVVRPSGCLAERVAHRPPVWSATGGGQCLRAPDWDAWSGRCGVRRHRRPCPLAMCRVASLSWERSRVASCAHASDVSEGAF